jgi:hypothetical protein
MAANHVKTLIINGEFGIIIPVCEVPRKQGLIFPVDMLNCFHMRPAHGFQTKLFPETVNSTEIKKKITFY